MLAEGPSPLHVFQQKFAKGDASQHGLTTITDGRPCFKNAVLVSGHDDGGEMLTAVEKSY